MPIIFVSGIDTDVGKSFATGALAKKLIDSGYTVYTQKLVETGCGINGKDRFSNDLLIHQKIVGKPFNHETPELHAPYLLKYPASPHLAASMEGTEIDYEYLKESVHQLATMCDYLIIEGAGGLCVPINNKKTIAHLIKDLAINTFLVTTPRLGSINHTLLSIDYCFNHAIKLNSIIFNTFDNSDSVITESTRSTLSEIISQNSNILWQELSHSSLSASNQEIISSLNS